MIRRTVFLGCLLAAAVSGPLRADTPAAGPSAGWTQWGGSPGRNNTPATGSLPAEWAPGEFDYESGDWQPETSKNILWVAPLGSQSYGNPVVAGGKVFVGTNNGHGYLERYPPTVDLGCLVALDLADGSFLWQDSSEKLPTGRVHDWPLQGICCAPLVEGDRLWYVTSRGEVKCLDTEGFRDGENDGPFTDEAFTGEREADVVWVLDMMKELGVSQHNMCSCSVTAAGDRLFVITSNGVDEGHINLPSPTAPSFICVDKRDGRVLWADATPGTNVLHGQWSSPAYAEIEGVPRRSSAAATAGSTASMPAAKTAKASSSGSLTATPRPRSTPLAAGPTATTSSARRWSTMGSSTSAWARIPSMARAWATCGASTRQNEATFRVNWRSASTTPRPPCPAGGCRR